MKIVALIQARLGSTRLPNKVLMEIEGQSMLRRVEQRAEAIQGVDGVCVICPYDDRWAIEGALLPDTDVVGVSGDPGDVLGRYNHAAYEVGADVIMRLTGDDPLLDPSLCEDVLKTYLAACSPAAFAHNVAPNTDGWDCEVFSAQLLRLAHLTATDPYAREHVTPFMRARGHVWFVPVEGDAPKLSVDTEEELETVRAIYHTVGRSIFSRQEALDALRTVAGVAQPSA